MQGISGLLETSALDVSTGRKIGIVEEAVLSLEEPLLLGIVVADGAFFSKRKFIAFASIFRIGFDAVMVKEDAAEEAGLVLAKLESGKVYKFKELRRRMVFSESGLQIGSVEDIMFDCESGELKTYVLSEGLLHDFIYGRSSIPLPPSQLVCEDRVIVPESMVKLRQ